MEREAQRQSILTFLDVARIHARGMNPDCDLARTRLNSLQLAVLKNFVRDSSAFIPAREHGVITQRRRARRRGRGPRQPRRRLASEMRSLLPCMPPCSSGAKEHRHEAVGRHAAAAEGAGVGEAGRDPGQHRRLGHDVVADGRYRRRATRCRRSSSGSREAKVVSMCTFVVVDDRAQLLDEALVLVAGDEAAIERGVAVAGMTLCFMPACRPVALIVLRQEGAQRAIAMGDCRRPASCPG